MNFHVGFLSSPDELKGAVDQSKKIDFIKESSLTLLGNAQNLTQVVLTGVCHRYPDLNFVSVENGAGWLPFLGEAMEASESPSPRDVMERSLRGVPDETAGQVLQHTATKLYNLEPPARNGAA